jgi:hypothetical protein
MPKERDSSDTDRSNLMRCHPQPTIATCTPTRCRLSSSSPPILCSSESLPREGNFGMSDQAVECDQLRAEVEQLSFRQLTLYDQAGEPVFTMTIGPRGCRWTAAEDAEPLQVSRVEIS